AIKRKQFEEGLFKAKLNAEESEKLKSQFLAQVSHEIRSPVNTILSFNSLIYEKIKNNIDNKVEANFKIINSASNRLIRTIDLILNMSEIQTGTYDFNPREIDIYSDILLSLIEETKITSQNSNVEFKIAKTTDDTTRNVDAYAVTQIFVNLLENAFKYTHKGSVELGIHTSEKNELVISVTDTGIGITKEYIPKLFNPFSQEEQGYSRTFEGNGLGLAIAKNYCEMNGSKIKVESEKGVGTTFKIIFQNN
ncbi:MAG: HAMP domain-containing sensor histidine kinase, partial [Melioribacteraceae bacterium]